MRGRSRIGGLRGTVAAALIAAAALTVAALPAGGNVALAPPVPCTPGVVINDSATDGHHQPTDVLSAWLSEANGGNLQAVIVVDLGNWDAEHDDPDIVAGYVFLFTKAGVTKFVRLSVDEEFNDDLRLRHLHVPQHVHARGDDDRLDRSASEPEHDR